jgi:hypothetical protein
MTNEKYDGEERRFRHIVSGARHAFDRRGYHVASFRKKSRFVIFIIDYLEQISTQYSFNRS